MLSLVLESCFNEPKAKDEKLEVSSIQDASVPDSATIDINGEWYSEIEKGRFLFYQIGNSVTFSKYDGHDLVFTIKGKVQGNNVFFSTDKFSGKLTMQEGKLRGLVDEEKEERVLELIK